jgi:hypothetical protein
MVVSRHAEEDREAASVNPENVELRYLEAKGFDGTGSTEPAAVDSCGFYFESWCGSV